MCGRGNALAALVKQAKKSLAPLAVQTLLPLPNPATSAAARRASRHRIMSDFSRRSLLSTFAAASTSALLPQGVLAQNQPAPAPRFGYEDVVRRARELAAAPYDTTPPRLPEELEKLDFDAWRDIRFRADKGLLASAGGPFRLQLFMLGHLFKRPVTVNTIRDGIATPIPFSTNLFDFGRTKLEKPLPVNLGFAGFRLHYPLNDPRVFDEAIAFLGASYFRFLGRGQRYGMSARGLAVNAGTPTEEFPFFREFWVEAPGPNADRATMYALLDGETTTGAYRLDLYPGKESVLDVQVALFARRSGAKTGFAPLTSMFFIGKNDHRFHDDFRPQLHDSEGLLVNSGTGEWLWRPLRNPAQMEMSAFLDRNVKGFGLIQRDRNFDHYQDLELAYETRPSYWVEPREDWGEGRVELVELPTPDETNDNIVAYWVPKDPLEPGKQVNFGYRITASLNLARLSPNARAINTFQTTPRALGSPEPREANARRFIIDFAGGDLGYFLHDPGLVEVVPSTSQGRIVRSSVVPNVVTQGIRATIDVQVEAGQTADLRAFLRAADRALTETWTFPWKAE
jgi:glucans biosynthesis protein